MNNDNIIKYGNWNPVINPDIDANNYLHINNPLARNESLDNICEENMFLNSLRKKRENIVGEGEIQYDNKQIKIGLLNNKL